MKIRKGITLVESLVVLCLVALLILLILPSLGGGGPRHSPHIKNMSNLRMIGMGLHAFAYDHEGYFPGLAAARTITHSTVQYRFQALLDAQFIEHEQLINPLEYDVVASWTAEQEEILKPSQYSYALAEIASPGLRQKAWQANDNSQSVLASDRNTGSSTQRDIQGLASEQPGQWRGAILWGDGHATFEESTTVNTKYNTQQDAPAKPDHLFEAPTPDDAYMIHSGS